MENPEAHAALVSAVQVFQKTGGRVIDDAWRSWVHDWGHERQHNPQKYSCQFLAHFLAHATTLSTSTVDKELLDTRRSLGYPRSEPARRRLAVEKKCYRELWFFVGAAILDDSFWEMARGLQVDVLPVALAADVITHSGVAMAQIIAGIQSGLFGNIFLTHFRIKSVYLAWPPFPLKI